jgi:hypothetical protein
MNHTSKILLLFAILVYTLSSCETDDCEGSIPSIKWKSLGVLEENQAILAVEFVDCDGDIGLESGDTNGVFSADSNNRYHYNLYIDYFELVDSVWTEVESNLRYRVPRLENDGASKTIEGDIEVTISPYYAPSDADTFRYEVVLIDRNLNESNKVVSPTFIKPN